MNNSLNPTCDTFYEAVKREAPPRILLGIMRQYQHGGPDNVCGQEQREFTATFQMRLEKAQEDARR